MKQKSKNYLNVVRSKLYLTLAVIIGIATLTPILASQSASAARLTSRSLSLSNNVTSTTSVTYTLTFTTASTTGGIEMAFCTTPLPGTTCAAPTGFSVASVGVSAPSGFVLGTTGNAPACSLTTNAAPLSSNTVAATGNTACGVRIHHPTTAAAAGATTVTLTGLTNPSASGTFFIRIATYGGVNNTYTTFQDDGTVANSVQDLQNLTFKVQEILGFCVGAMANTSVAFGSFSSSSLTDDCAQSAGTSINLGIGTASLTCITPVSVRSSGCVANADGDNRYGYAMLRTNAGNGAVIGYRTNNAGSFTQGTLQISGATCAAFGSANRADSCINPVNADAGVANGSVAPWLSTSSPEQFGMVVPAVNSQGRGTNLLTNNPTSVTEINRYIGSGNLSGGTACTTGGAGAQDCWNFHRNQAATLATSSQPVDNEAIQILFAAKPGITTPTGTYAVDLDYYSVPTY